MSTVRAERYFEDYTPGAVMTSGPVIVEEAEIIEFASRYDPQPMHTDPVAAATGHFGGLIASGWHTGALMIRLFAMHFLAPASSVASPGVDEVRWFRPVRPGDQLTLRVTVLETTPSRVRPGQGIVQSLVEALNQRGELVMSLKPTTFIRCRRETATPSDAATVEQ